RRPRSARLCPDPFPSGRFPLQYLPPVRLTPQGTTVAIEVLISADRIQQRVDELAGEIVRDYGHQPITIVGVLTGSIMFLADLMRRPHLPLRIALIPTSSYPRPNTR